MTDEALQRFKELWKEEFAEELSDTAAIDEATALLTLFNAIYRPIKKEWLKDLEKESQ